MKSLRNSLRSILSIAIIAGLLFTVAAPAQLSARDLSARQRANQSIQKHSRQVLHLKLRANTGLSLSKGVFVGGPADQTAQLNSILSAAKRVKADKLVTQAPRSDIEAKLQDSVKNYYRVSFAQDIDVASVISKLKTLSIIDTAYAEALPVPPPSTPNYTGLQTYLQPSPKGTNANFASTFPGGTGDKVSIIDIEYGWNLDHEDLAKAKTAFIPNGTPVIPNGWDSHGTAVLGEIIATNNSFGVTGAIPNVNLGLVNINNAERGYDILTAMAIAAWVTKPGDVIMIEQQAFGPSPQADGYVPVEWTPEVYDYVKVLTDSGRIVVEPAGNGNQNLDDPTYYGASFPAGKPDSGAIIVGAGQNCTGGPALLSRVDFGSQSSNYGKRVNLQGPGNCVVTTGWTGDLSSATPNSYYTQSFAGTSSATPVVAAAAAALSSSYKALNNNAVLTPIQVRTILTQTGVAQNTSVGTLPGNIGPYPNLAAALLKADITAPLAPSGLSIRLNSNKKPILTWKASTDNVKVASYRIYRDGNLKTTTSSLSFTDTSTVRGRKYSYKVVAVDASGNASAPSTTVSITTR